jgi:stress-induced morphogen
MTLKGWQEALSCIIAAAAIGLARRRQRHHRRHGTRSAHGWGDGQRWAHTCADHLPIAVISRQFSNMVFVYASASGTPSL